MYSLKDLNIELIINYLRKSRQDIEREKKTGEDTLSEMRNLMERVLDNYETPYITKEEIGSGDQIATRPVFMEIIKELENGKYQAIAVKEISRLGRGQYEDMGKIFDLIKNNRIFIITPWKIYDPNNSADLRQIRFEMFLAREEYETIKERLMGARYNYAMQGKWMAGSIPYGYKFNENTQRLEIFEDEAKVVRLFFKLYAYGLDGKTMGFAAIANYLTKLGIKTAKGKNTWRPRVLERMVNNTVYIGQVRFRITKRINNNKKIVRPEEEWIIANEAHDPIINETLWLDAQERYKNRNKTPRTKMDFSPCELASLVICAKCGRKMVRQYSVENYKCKDGSISKYHKEFLWCTTPGCTFIKYRDVEDKILTGLTILSELNDNKLETVLQESINSENQNEINQEEIIKTLNQRIIEVKRRMNFIYDKYESGIYSDEVFLERKGALEKELNELKTNLSEQQNKIIPEQQKINISTIKGKIRTVVDVYKTLKNKTDKNRLLHNIIDKVELERLTYGVGRTPSTFDISIKINTDFLVQS